MKKILSKITNGILLIIIGLLHTKLVVSGDGCGAQFSNFAKTNFFRICGGINELPAAAGKTNFESFAAFWFFYFGILLIPLGLLVHAIERKYKVLPHAFTISYLALVAIGAYMVPTSGMTYIMLPHAVFMLAANFYKAKKLAQKKN